MADARSDGAGSHPLDAVLKAQHYSTKGVGAFIRFLDQREGREVIDGALADAGLPRDYVTAEDLWVSREWQARFQRALAGRLYQLAELPPHDHAFWQLWREGAHAAASREGIGPLYDVVRTLGSPGLAYRQVPSLMRLYNRTTSVDVETVGPRALRMGFTPVEPGESVDAALYWNVIGTLERMPVVWDLPHARVEEEEGPFLAERPSRRLVVVVRYTEPESARWWRRALGGAIGGAVGGTLGAVAGAGGWTAMAGLAGAMAAAWLLEMRWRREAEVELQREGRQLEALIAAQDGRYQTLWEEEKKLRRSLLARKKLSGYLPADLVEEIRENPEMETRLGGKRTDAAVLFADLVGFTPRTEGRDPETVVDELNLYFRHIDPAFLRHDGVIDKRMGDGVMGVFVPRGDEAPESVRLRAVRCGLDLLRGVEACNVELAARGTAPLAARVGIAAGPLVQGTMGSQARFEYTVIGDVVNTAARLEGQATAGHLVVSAEVFDSLPEGVAIEGWLVDRRVVRVKGKASTIDVVELAATPLDLA